MVIVIQCRDEVGLIAGISRILAESKMNIISMLEHVDPSEPRFFVRVESDGPVDPATLRTRLLDFLPNGAELSIDPFPNKRIVVLVTKEHHCLSDILVRNHFKTLGAEVLAVIGNHANLRELSERFGIPYHTISHEGKTKEVFEAEILSQIDHYAPDFVVLAKFMRILSPSFVEKYPSRVINIHHSFLPAFVGADPYRQAYARGVKLIGATAHFVTNDLDDGPIITQQIIPVDHTYTAANMRKAGLEIETAVLARALNLAFEDRILVHGNKTVVFE